MRQRIHRPAQRARPFLYADHATLVRAANDLQHLFRVHGPRPGEQLRVPSAEGPITSSRVGWVKPDTEAERRGLAQLQTFLAHPQLVTPTPISEPIPAARWDQARNQIAHELPRLARDLIATRTGALVTSIHDYLHGPLNGRGWPTPSPPTPTEPKSRPTHCSPITTTSSDRYPCGVSRPATAAPPSRSANHRTVGLRLV